MFRAATESLVEPGPPELWVYSKAEPVLRAFLPRVFLAAEAGSGRSGVYVLEDLTWEYGRNRVSLGWRHGVLGMFQLHETLASAVDAYGGDDLVRYDAVFSRALVSYAEQAIVAFDDPGDGEVRDQVLEAWPQLEAAYLDDEFSIEGVPIHGDYNESNVFIHRRDHDRVKAVDWEWSGFGSPHADLASHLKSAPPEVVSWALDEIAARDQSRTRPEHERMFLRSALERAIWDSALLAMQFTSDRSRFGHLRSWINGSLARALWSLDQLGRS